MNRNNKCPILITTGVKNVLPYSIVRTTVGTTPSMDIINPNTAIAPTLMIILSSRTYQQTERLLKPIRP